MRIRYTDPARQDVAALLTYTKRHWPGHVQKVRDRIREVERLLADFPEAGPLTERSGVRRYGLRSFPYVIFYRVMLSEIVIISVYHAARRPSGTNRT